MNQKEKTQLLRRLKDFSSFISLAVRHRGEHLWRSKHVQSVQYFPDQNFLTSKVVSANSSIVYEVEVPLDNFFNSHCTCPYEWGFCKHLSATLFFLINGLQRNPKNFLTINQEETPVEIAKLDKRWIKKHTPNELDEETAILEKNADIQLKAMDDGHIKLDIKINGVSIPVEFVAKKETNKVTTKCTCKDDRNILCKHKIAGLKYLNKNYKSDIFDTCLNWQEEKELLAARYGLTPEQVEKSKVLHFSFDNRNIEFGHKTDRLMSKELLYLIPTDNKGLDAELTSDMTSFEDFDIAYLLEVSYFNNGVPRIACTPYKGKLTKDRSRIKSNFESIIDPIEDDVFQQKAENLDYEILRKSTRLKSILKEIEYIPKDQKLDYHIISRIYSVLSALFESLTERRVYTAFSEYGFYKLKLKDCTPIEVSSQKIKVSIAQKMDKDTGRLQISYLLGGERIVPDNKKKTLFWAFMRNSTLHPWQNSAALFLYELADYENSEQFSFISQQSDFVFERFIRFFQDKLEVKILDNSVQPLHEAAIEKRIYLKEKDGHILFIPVMVYGETVVNLMHHSTGALYHKKQGVTYEIARDKEVELETLELIRSTHSHFSEQFQPAYFYLTVEQMLSKNWFIGFYEKCRNHDVKVFGFKDLKSVKYHPARASVSYSIKSGEDWFDVDMKVSFDGQQVSLKDLRRAMVNKENLVPIGDGVYGLLPDEFIKKFETSFKVGELEQDKIKLRKSHFTIIHNLLDQQSDQKIAKELSEKMEMLKSFDSIETVHPPKKLKATLRDYQKAGLSWLAFLAKFGFGGCLADDMGLGKTVQMLAFFAHLKEKDARKKQTHLVVCPTTLLFNWQHEIEKFTPHLKPMLYWGTQRKFDEKEFKKHDIILTSYGTMVNDIENLSSFRFTSVVFDESQAMKNPSSLRFKAALLLRAQHRYSLTGTPIENNTIELFSQMHVLNPGLLGTFGSFKKTYAKNMEGKENKHLRQELRRLIYPFIIRRTKEKVAAELPEKSEIELYCEMGEQQRKVYDAFREQYKDKLLNQIDQEGLNKARFNVLDGILKLRQICDSPTLINTEEYYGDESAKADELMRYILEKTKNHKVLVFSQFVKMLGLIQKRLDENEVVYTSLDGSTRDREGRVDYFQNTDECRVFLISLKAGGYGLNLTAADYVFLIDPWWNPAVESQAIDRTHRIGQDKKVFAYRMICQNTIEEKILNLQKRKKNLADEIITAESSFVKRLTAKDIEHLFS